MQTFYLQHLKLVIFYWAEFLGTNINPEYKKEGEKEFQHHNATKNKIKEKKIQRQMSFSDVQNHKRKNQQKEWIRINQLTSISLTKPSMERYGA